MIIIVSEKGTITVEELELFAGFSITTGQRIATEGYSNVDDNYTDKVLESKISVAEGMYEGLTGDTDLSSESSNVVKSTILMIAKNLMDLQQIEDEVMEKPKDFAIIDDNIKMMIEKGGVSNVSFEQIDVIQRYRE